MAGHLLFVYIKIHHLRTFIVWSLKHVERWIKNNEQHQTTYLLNGFDASPLNINTDPVLLFDFQNGFKAKTLNNNNSQFTALNVHRY